ncbi:MAG: cyclic nucleotide-binding domain-containing protein, partial [Ginsengibacter sp.]
ERGDKLYIIDKGEVTISQPNDDGEERILAKLGEGAFFGELSLLDGGPHSGTARALNATSIMIIDQASFYKFLEKHADFYKTLLSVLVERLRFSADTMRITNINSDVAHSKRSFLEHLAERTARIIASSGFLVFVSIFIVGWISMQTWMFIRSHREHLDFHDTPPTFFILGFIITLTSFLLTILVLTSQKALADRDRIRADIEYQVNLKAQAEIMRLQLKMDDVLSLLNDKQVFKSEEPRKQ